MNFRIPVAGILIALLVACSDSKPNATVPSTPEQQQAPQSQQEVKQSPETGVTKPTNPFHSISFPKESCGDQPPDKSKTNEDYPAIFYPVFVNYSEKNFELIKKYFCRDAFRNPYEKFYGRPSKDIVQIASFNNRERAKKFKEKIAYSLNDVNVGDPHLIKKYNYVSSKLPEIFTTQKIEKIKKIAASSSLTLKVLLPRYVPNGFEIFVFISRDLYFSGFSRGVDRNLNLGYKVIFLREKDNRCFSLGTTLTPRGASGDGLEDRIVVNSPVFKNVSLQYNTFSNIKDNPHILLDLDALDISQSTVYAPGIRIFSYVFESGTQHEWDESIKGQSNYDKVSAKFRSCQGIELREAIKIIESIDYIDQKHPANISFHTGR